MREKFGLGENEIVIGSLGNIRLAKGYDILLQAAALLENSEWSFRFAIAGGGKEKDVLLNNLLALR